MYWLRRFKFSILVQLVIITIGGMTLGQTPESHAQLLRHLGMSWEILTEGRFWHLFTGTWVQSHPGLGWPMVSMCLMVAVGTFPTEFRAGSKLTAIILVTADWFATIMTAITLRWLVELDRLADPTILHQADAGTSALAWAGMATGATMYAPRWLLIPLVVAAVIWQFTVESSAAAIAHGFAVAYGLCAGWWFSRQQKSAS